MKNVFFLILMQLAPLMCFGEVIHQSTYECTGNDQAVFKRVSFVLAETELADTILKNLQVAAPSITDSESSLYRGIKGNLVNAFTIESSVIDEPAQETIGLTLVIRPIREDQAKLNLYSSYDFGISVESETLNCMIL